jgi:ABC-type dipeptide/oligopeptide/nickel transport system permease component
MWTFLVRRLIQAVPVLVGISIITFLLIYYLPADPARMYAGPSATAQTVARIRHQLGLDQPFWVQYGTYMERVLHGDLGFSYRKQIAVTDLIASRIPYTLALIVGGVLVELMIGLPVGIISALWRGAEGLDVQHGKHLLIADTPDAFAQEVIRLLKQPELRQRLSDKAYQLVREKYDWAVVMPRFLNLVERVAHG